MYQFAFSPTVHEGALSYTHSPAFIVCRVFDDDHFDRCEVIPIVVLMCISLIMTAVEHLFTCVGHLYVFFVEMFI